ncbi:uncharacterized protein LOC100369269 [Saccoglossus kowalevskii]|uniref:Dr1-associated corepressor-like n=1 Tax=Saccoglossus kowalevskii TaxID=10224 RepID=A0ABM0GNE1_SACKO|nr:PREDICTED: dr1-associated corepressor-like [Saccoglossus kowalevskii]
MPSKKKKYNSRFPPARIKKIMQTDEDVGKVAAPVPVLISKALEIFVKSLITKANEQTQSRNAKTMTTAHIKLGILNESKFDFLKDLVQNIPDIAAEEDEAAEQKTKHSVKNRKVRNNKTTRSSTTSEESTAEADSDVSDDEETIEKPVMKVPPQQPLARTPAFEHHAAGTNTGIPPHPSSSTSTSYSTPHSMQTSTLPTMPQMPHLPLIPQQSSYIPQMYLPSASCSAMGVLPTSTTNNQEDDDDDYDS